ncbi:cell division protein FtsQ/DivIB [Sinomonas sp. ASV486]|nr:cell division protein FtsQ/DivIB [Sinomonas sp. ASV486]
MPRQPRPGGAAPQGTQARRTQEQGSGSEHLTEPAERAADRFGVPSDRSRTASDQTGPPAAARTAGDAARSPLGGRVTVGNGAKVTLLSTARDGVDGRGAPTDASAAGTPDASTHEPERSRKREGPRFRFGRGTGKATVERGTGGQTAEGPGSAEVLAFPEPPAKRHRRHVLIGGIAAVAVVAGLFAMLLFTPLIAVRKITVQGTHLLPVQRIDSALAPLRGRPLATVGSDDVARLLGQFVEVKSVKSRAVPPDTLVVQIAERVPVALVKQDKKLLIVDGDGVVLGEAADLSQYAVPVIDGSAMPMGQSVFRAVTAVLAALPADVLGKLATASAQSADSVELKLSDGRTVLWGNADDRELKARVLSALMKAAESPVKGQAPPQVFDVSTPRHPVTH